MKRLVYNLIVFLFILIALVCAAAGFFAWKFLYTAKGGEIAAIKTVEHFIDHSQMRVASSSGNLREGIVFKDLELAFLHERSQALLKIQELTLKIDTLNPNGLVVNIHNGRLVIPQADPILFFGNIDRGKLNIDLSTKSLNSRVLTDNLPVRFSSDLSFEMSDVDLNIKGAFNNLNLMGNLVLNKVTYKKFEAEQSEVRIEGDIKKDTDRKWKPLGKVFLKGGNVRGEKTATVDVKRGAVKFDNSWKEPYLDIKGESKIEKVKINILVRGKYNKPKITLTSDPPLPQDKLLLMVATNRTWSATEQAIKSGQVLSTDVAKDLLNYFLLSGEKNTLLKKVGIREIDVQVERGKRGISVIKDVTNNLSASYGVTQIMNTEVQNGYNVQQQIGGEYRFNENISAEFKKGLYFEQDETQPAPENQIAPDDRFLFKFEKTF